jgi:hypothetical protein
VRPSTCSASPFTPWSPNAIGRRGSPARSKRAESAGEAGPFLRALEVREDVHGDLAAALLLGEEAGVDDGRIAGDQQL